MRVIAAIAAGMLGAAAVPSLGQEREAEANVAETGTAPVAETAEQPAGSSPRPSPRDQIEALINSLLPPRQPVASAPPAEATEAGSATAVTDPQTPPAGAGSPDVAGAAGTPTVSPVIAQQPTAAPAPSAAAPAPDATLAVEGLAADSSPGAIAADDPLPVAPRDSAGFGDWWALLAGIALLALMALAAQQFARRSRLARTRGALAVTPFLDPDGGAASTTPLSFAGPSASIQVKLEEGAIHV